MKDYKHFFLLWLSLFSTQIHRSQQLWFTNSSTQYFQTDPSSDLFLNTTQVITKYGYTAEEYVVVTVDGYILAMSRIKNSGPAVFIMHGLLNSADDWLSRGADALPFLLANEGYDVYLGNARGNKYCRKHVSLTPKQKEFWNFSFHEIGFYDVPTMIDRALEISKASQISYVGFSQGTVVFYVMTSLKPEYNDKINLMVSMATVAWLHHAKTPIFKTLIPLSDTEGNILYTLGIYDLFAYDVFWRFITTKLCPSSKTALLLCLSALDIAYGFDYGQLNYSRLPTEIGRNFEGTSVKQLLHFAQVSKFKNFQQYNYPSTETNLKVYGTPTPPSYPVENITVPVAIMQGDNDWIASIEDVKILTSKLQNVLGIYRIPYKKWNHIDFMWGKDAKELVYDGVLKLMQSLYSK